MGLLDIALTLHDDDAQINKGLFYKASQVKINPSELIENTILVQKSATTFTGDGHRETEDSTENDQNLFFINGEFFSTKLEEFPLNADTPLYLFSFLKKELGIEKGSLLLLDPEKKVYFPWAITGYDETTNHRLRIPYELLQSILTTEEEPVFILSTLDNDTNQEKIKKYFSLREFSILERLLFLPLEINDEVFGLLIATSAKSFSSEDELLNLLKENQEKISNIIYQSRADHLFSTSVSSLKEKDEAITTVSHLIATLPHTSTGLVLFVFDLNKIIKQILKNNEDADSLRIREDVLRILTPMISENGSIVTLDTLQLLIVIPKSRLRRNDLFAHQIASAIKGYFSLPNSAPNPISHIKAFPDDGTNAEELLSDILN